MKTHIQGETLRVSGIKELTAGEANALREEVQAAFGEGQRNIQVDLSEATFIDSCGLGALVSLHKAASSRHGRLRLVNPQPAVRQILELTRMQRVFDIEKS